MSKNKVELLAGVFGGKRKLANVIGVSPSMITKLIKRGDVLPAHRAAILQALPDILKERFEEDARETVAALVMVCLPAAVCPCCGQSIEGRVI